MIDGKTVILHFKYSAVKYLKEATTKDLIIIQELAHVIWHKAYSEIITRDMIEYMLQLFYSEAGMKADSESGHRFYTVIWESKPLGFVDVARYEEGFFIHKFYLLPDTHNHGLGSLVMEELIHDVIKEQFPVRLHVNRQNYKAVNFYFKNKFVIEGVKDTDIGHGYFMDDFVMIRRR